MKTNPFVLSPAIPDEYFCDRQTESASLIKSFKNQENVVLISPRRVGKTGLIYHCFNQPEIHVKLQRIPQARRHSITTISHKNGTNQSSPKTGPGLAGTHLRAKFGASQNLTKQVGSSISGYAN